MLLSVCSLWRPRIPIQFVYFAAVVNSLAVWNHMLVRLEIMPYLVLMRLLCQMIFALQGAPAQLTPPLVVAIIA